MSPEGNNPTTNTGAGATGAAQGASSVPPALDFTTSDTTSLSMADSLASAADDLTSAGMAAKLPDNGSIGLGQIGSSDPTATMERPDEPLVPAAPVPGSIGSAMSGPAMVASAPVQPAGDMNTGVTAGFGAMPAMNNMNPGMDTAVTPAQPQTTPFNPFATQAMQTNVSAMHSADHAATSTAAMPKSSTEVPAGLQPATEKFFGKIGGDKKINFVTVALGILAAVSLIMAIVFAVMWQNALKEKEIVYIEKPTEPVQSTMSILTCAQDLGAEQIEGLANLTNHLRVATLTFADDDLATLMMENRYTFADAESAEASRGYFDGVNNWYTEVAANLGVAALGTTIEVNGAEVNYDISAVPGQIAGDYISVMGMTALENGAIPQYIEDLQANYEGSGFVCSVE